MTSLVTVQKEVEKIKQKVKPEEPKDIWLSWHISEVTRESIKRDKEYYEKHGKYPEHPDDIIEVMRVTTRAYPKFVKFRCKRSEVSEKIAEVQNREQRQS